MAAFSLTDEPVDAILDLTTPALSNELSELEARLHVVHGLLDALGRINEVNKVVQFSRDRYSALVTLQNEPLGYSRQQAEAVLDMPMSWQTSDEAERLRAERDHLRARRAAMREHVSEVLTFHWFG
jgi:DNA gyrase subunit A